MLYIGELYTVDSLEVRITLFFYYFIAEFLFWNSDKFKIKSKFNY